MYEIFHQIFFAYLARFAVKECTSVVVIIYNNVSQSFFLQEKPFFLQPKCVSMMSSRVSFNLEAIIFEE